MTVAAKSSIGILSDERSDKREEIVGLLTRAYWMEIESVMSYTANAANLDGLRAEEIAGTLAGDVDQELGHARTFAARIKELYGTPPGSREFTAEQTYLQPADPTDAVGVIRGVIEAEAAAVEHYNHIIDTCDGIDWATQDMVIEILRDEERHLRQFERFLREYE